MMVTDGGAQGIHLLSLHSLEIAQKWKYSLPTFYGIDMKYPSNLMG